MTWVNLTDDEIATMENPIRLAVKHYELIKRVRRERVAQEYGPLDDYRATAEDAGGEDVRQDRDAHVVMDHDRRGGWVMQWRWVQTTDAVPHFALD